MTNLVELDVLRKEQERISRSRATAQDEEAVVSSGPFGEDALALRFVESFGTDYRSVPSWGFVTFEGTRWVRDLGLRHFDVARKLCREIASAPECGSTDKKRLASAKTIAAVVQLVRADQRIVVLPDRFDADPRILNTPAGPFDLSTGTPLPRNRDYLTKVTSIAPDFRSEPTTWLRFLADVCDGDEALIGFLRRLLGYCLTGETREQIIAFFLGDGANGKSTLLDLVLELLDSYGTKIPSAMLMAQRGQGHPTDIAGLCGVRTAVANEVSEGEHWDESRVKELTGDTRLTARFMRQDFFQFNATHKIIIAANHRPQVRAMDHAMRRRLLLVPFRAHFSGDRRDPRMLAKLRREGGAILAWLIGGAREWYERGLMVPEQVRAASDEYAAAMDSMGLWLSDCCVQTGDPSDRERAKALYDSYSDWKGARGESPVSMTRWGEQLRSRGYEKVANNGMQYLGLLLTSDERSRLAEKRRGE